MRIRFDNVDLSSNSGPNSFALKLANFLLSSGIQVSIDDREVDIQLSFIQSNFCHDKIIQRLDGIYFNSAQDWKRLNDPIKITFQKSAAVIYQSNFNKELSEKYFGIHNQSRVIQNGTNLQLIGNISPMQHELFDTFDNVWSCASSWRPHKRLKENIRYFLEHGSRNDCLVVAGSNPDHVINHERIFYVGNLDWQTLIGLYKASNNFIHLALLDHCPNVVVDARAAGCHIVCTDSGGTKEIAGLDATIIKDLDWDFKPLKLYEPPDLDFTMKYSNKKSSIIDIKETGQKYVKLFEGLI